MVVPDINTLEWIQLFFTLDHALEQQEQTQTNKPKKKKAKKEKLQSTQNHVKGMSEDALKDKVSAFLNAHPEFCDDFNG